MGGWLDGWRLPPKLALQLSRACCPNDVQRLLLLFLLFAESFISLLVCFVLYFFFFVLCILNFLVGFVSGPATK